MKQELLAFGKEIVAAGKKNSPTILSGLAVAGLFATAWLSYKAGKKVPDILDRKRADLKDVRPGDKEAKNAVLKEAAIELAPVVLPPVVMGVTTGACIIGGNTISNRRIATLSAAYALSESAVKDLNNKMVEVLGEKKARSVKDAIVKDHLETDEKNGNVPIVALGTNEVLCRDGFSGLYFKSNAQKIEQAISELTFMCMNEMYVSLNDFYGLLGLESAMIGDEFGWSADDIVRGRLPISISAQLTSNSEPCLCVDYDAMLRPDYRKLYQ